MFALAKDSTQQMDFPEVADLYEEYIRLTCGGVSSDELRAAKRSPNLDVIRSFGSFMADYGQALHIVAANAKKQKLVQGAGDPDPSRVLGAVAGFMEMCGYPDVAKRFLSEITKTNA